MRILVLGGSGMLGTDVVRTLRERNYEVTAPAHDQLNLHDLEQIAAIPQGGYEWVVNCAAYTAVDRAESERDEAAFLNTLAPRYIAMACSMSKTRMLHLSTDYVFDGTKEGAYEEDDETNPQSVYGLTKRDGEEGVLMSSPDSVVVRTSWLYGPTGKSFPRTIVGAWKSGKQLRVVADQIGCPTYTPDLATTIADLIDLNAAGGTYHACGPDVVSWHEFAVRVLSAYTMAVGDTRPIHVAPISTEDWPTPAKRPRNSVLSCEKLGQLGIAPMRPLGIAIEDFVQSVISEGS